jgi:diguanylate cyclase (GGDEF)-like protein
MISIRKFLESVRPAAVAAGIPPDEVFAVSLACYRAALVAMGRSAARVCPGFGADLETGLQGLEQRLAYEQSPDSLIRTEQLVEVHLQEWSSRSSEHFKAQAHAVKELFIALAHTAESVGNRDRGYSDHQRELVAQLERVADLDDLTQIRSSLLKNVAELKVSIDQLARNNCQLVDHLRSEISTYETKLKSAEPTAFKDDLTGMPNRHILEERIRLNIDSAQEFCIVMLTVNQLQQVNQQQGRLAGDDLLRQFAKELRINTRASDLVGRWGGGEFVIVLSGDAEAAKAYLVRMQGWVFGRYTVKSGNRSIEIRVDASIGTAQWAPGKTVELLIAEADSARYLDENLARRRQ